MLPAVQIASNTPVPAHGASGAAPAEPVTPPSDKPVETPAVHATSASAAEHPSAQLRQPERPVPVYKTRIPPTTTTEKPS
ncbi:MAG: hypothetical protein EBX38_05250 [Actinobacteria bacterium]|nr:hypothetical protein [Actinomycetota bacterium]